MAAPFNPKASLRVRAQYEKMEERAACSKLSWYRKNYERVYLNPALPADKIPKKAAVLFNELLEQELLAKENEELEKERKYLLKSLPSEDEGYKLTVEELLARGPMFPVPEMVKVVLYEGISHNDEGRKLYLKLRIKKGIRLEEKFYDPITISHGYGWNVQERYIQPSVHHGKKQIIKQSFFKGNGALKFDSHLWREPI